MDRFMKAAGLVKEEQLSHENLSILIGHAEAFLRSGVDFETWSSLSDDSKAALVIANDRIWRERCSLIGVATQSPLAATYVRDEQEGHDAVASAALDSFVSNMEEAKK